MENEETKEIKTTLKKNQTAEIPTKSGGKYSYQYVDIAQIHEYLESIGMRYYQYIDRIDGDDYIMTVKVRVEDGTESQPLRGCRVVDATLMGSTNPAQIQGSAITYARRYSLLMAFGLATEDDDANSLSEKEKETTLEEALESKFTFGQYKGELIYDIYLSDKQYIEYLVTGETPNQRIKTCYDLFEKMPISTLNKLIAETSTPVTSITNHYKKASLKDLTAEEIEESIKILESKKISLGNPKNILEEAERQIKEGV